jgi:hypothetical protein
MTRIFDYASFFLPYVLAMLYVQYISRAIGGAVARMQSAHFCVHEKERCTSDVLNFMWRNFAMLASRLFSTTPSPEVLELAIQYHRYYSSTGARLI